jgi:SAM-dependent methyltransferase
MLAQAKSALKQHANRLDLREHLFADIPWANLGRFNMVFSAFAIHHLTDFDKARLYAQISACILPRGCFVLFDSFRPRGGKADALLEYLSCADIRRRHKRETGRDVPLVRVIETDRRKKAEQGDKEASLQWTLSALTEVGLGDVGLVFAEGRLAGLVAFEHRDASVGA